MTQKRRLLTLLPLTLIIIFTSLTPPTLLGGASFLRKLGNVLEFINDANQILWLLGDPASERRFGYTMSRFLMAFYKIDKNGERNRYVSKIFQRVVEPGRRRHFQYRIYVVNSKEINAFALPGGYIFVNTGMIDFVKSDDELACVIAHELAHVNRRHSLNKLRRNYAFLTLINELFDDNTSSDRRNDTTAKVTWLFLEQKNSRNNEREADRLGMEWAMKAGYNPSGMVTLWERMEKKYPHQRDALSKMLSTHPPHKERAKTARTLIAKWGLEFTETDFLTIGVNAAAAGTVNIDGAFEDKGKWNLSSGTSIDPNGGRNHSNCLRIERTNLLEECTARSKSFPFTADSSLTVSASVKALRGSLSKATTSKGVNDNKTIVKRQEINAYEPGKIWLGVEFLDSSKNVIDVSFFAANGAPTVENTWVTFSNTLSQGKNNTAIPLQTKHGQIVIAGCEEPGQSIVVDNISSMVASGASATADRSEGEQAPLRGTVRVNLLPNGSFEKDKDGDLKPDRWTFSGGTRLSYTGPSHGSALATMTGIRDGRREFAVSERIPVKGGSRYVLLGWFKGTKRTNIEFGVRIFSSNYSEIRQGKDLQNHLVARNVWTIREQRVTVPGSPQESLYMQIWIRSTPEKDETVDIDNLALFQGNVK